MISVMGYEIQGQGHFVAFAMLMLPKAAVLLTSARVAGFLRTIWNKRALTFPCISA
jgi:hypothetical protein